MHELDWHADYLFQQISIRALPAYHYSKRDIFTRNRRLWASFAVCLPNKKIYFSGDTAYGSLFLDIGRDYGPFDYALLSVGSYEPRELMSTGHLRPEEAVHIGQELRAKKLVGMHWGAIRLSDEAPFEPPERFYASAIQAGFLPDCIWLMRIGETRTI
ncbi:MBL fold metallo-hydrolase [Aquicella lusitana]|uniref:MBL fold metallo-hydrolase n=1 Tax=Aquicella lusitana TaxID=254246 RepID=UPI000E0BA317